MKEGREMKESGEGKLLIETKEPVSGCCGGSRCDCSDTSLKKQVLIEFLYLDLSQCDRCQGTDANLDEAIAQVRPVLAAAGFDLKVEKINVNTKELAIKHQFLSSPTIRVNGQDIDFVVRESDCRECGDLCGDQVSCRVYDYEGTEHNEPPRSMIIEAILKQIFGGARIMEHQTEYVLPENLARFYERMEELRGV